MTRVVRAPAYLRCWRSSASPSCRSHHAPSGQLAPSADNIMHTTTGYVSIVRRCTLQHAYFLTRAIILILVDTKSGESTSVEVYRKNVKTFGLSKLCVIELLLQRPRLRSSFSSIEAHQLLRCATNSPFFLFSRLYISNGRAIGMVVVVYLSVCLSRMYCGQMVRDRAEVAIDQ